tara:strand:+ start:2169 stop:2333 length:165 start_codon:yes stop_codon:yes gene_type:complete
MPRCQQKFITEDNEMLYYLFVYTDDADLQNQITTFLSENSNLENGNEKIELGEE